MATVTVSLFKNIRQLTEGKPIPLDIFLNYIQDGRWQDEVLAVRTGKLQKTDLPYCTLSGTFSERKIDGLLVHSGFICIDIDDITDPEDLKSIVCVDQYIYSAFVSVSGKGLALLFKINPDKHGEAFEGIQEYLFNTYQIVVDPSCRDVSRARFVSFDPAIYINEKANKFTYYPKKQPALKKIPEIVWVKSDFDSIVKEIVSRRIDITNDYQTWLRIGFSLSDRLGENGRGYFHQISQFHPTYTPDLCERQYSNCMKAGRSGITIASFYYYAKQAGISIMSDQTKLIVQSAVLAKKGARTKDSVVQYLHEAEGINSDTSTDIINQVFDNNISIDTKENEIDSIELWMRQNYDFKRNIITRYIENSGKALQSKDFNTIYIAAKKIFTKCNYELIDRLVNSDFTTDYHPILDFFEKYKSRRPTGIISSLFDTVDSDTGLSDTQFFPDYKIHFGTKWLVGLIALAHGNHSPLCLVLSGKKQGTGKTEWWRRLLPPELRHYYAESKLDAGKDDEILMTQKWIIMDDEMGGKSKKESTRLKELTSKQVFSLREPYGRNNVDLQRLAALGGTTNDDDLLNDPTGNRRLIPINVLSINHAAYNAIDKIDVLMEAYHLYLSGYNWHLSSEDIKILNDNTINFEQYSIEYELITKYYDLPASNTRKSEISPRTTTDIKVRLEQISNQRLSLDRIGKELKRIGYHNKSFRIDGYTKKAYEVIEKGVTSILSAYQ